MKKRMMAVYALVGALAVSPALTSCVDDDSTTIEAHRNSEVEQLKALASLHALQAETEKIEAEADAALKKAEAAYIQQSAEAIPEQLAVLKSQFKNVMEYIKLEQQRELAKLKKDLLTIQQNLQKSEDKRLEELSNEAISQTIELLSLQEQKLFLENQLTSCQHEIVENKELAPLFVKNLEEENSKIQARIDFIKKYEQCDKEELEKMISEANKEYFEFEMINTPKAVALHENRYKLNSTLSLFVYDEGDYENHEVAQLPRFTLAPKDLISLVKYCPEKITALQKALNAYGEKYSFQMEYNVKTGKPMITAVVEEDDYMTYNLYDIELVNGVKTAGYMLIAPNEEGFEAANKYIDQLIEDARAEVGEPASEDKPATGYCALLADAEKALQDAIENEESEEQIKSLKEEVETAKKNLEIAQEGLAEIELYKKDYADMLALVSPDSPEMKEYMAEIDKVNILIADLKEQEKELLEISEKGTELYAKQEALEDLYQNHEEIWDIIKSLESDIRENNEIIENIKNEEISGDALKKQLETKISALDAAIVKAQEMLDEIQKRIDAMMASEEK